MRRANEQENILLGNGAFFFTVHLFNCIIPNSVGNKVPGGVVEQLLGTVQRKIFFRRHFSKKHFFSVATKKNLPHINFFQGLHFIRKVRELK
jgi:hypothetical protein